MRKPVGRESRPTNSDGLWQTVRNGCFPNQLRANVERYRSFCCADTSAFYRTVTLPDLQEGQSERLLPLWSIEALDNLGILYFDSFLGTINRTLRTESYHYDLYYPGETTETE